MTKKDKNSGLYGRDEVRKGLFQDLAAEAEKTGALTPLSTDERAQSLTSFMDKRPDEARSVWVFGYGSLIWNPAFHYTDRQPMTVHGYHRSFCLSAPVGRGTPENPGLLLGLDRGGSCKGIGLCVPEGSLMEELTILWSREMMGGSYRPCWAQAKTDNGTRVPVIAFVIRREGERYYKSRNYAEMAAKIVNAKGTLGPCSDYVFRTEAALESYAISDPVVARMANEVRQLLKKPA